MAILSMLLFPFMSAFAQDEEQTELRLNPEIEMSALSDIDYDSYPFLNLKANRIELNGDDWSRLTAKFGAATRRDSLFSVVYLGDSHIQADFSGDVLRRRLSDRSAKAGRGMIIPFSLASTNEPNDYTIRTDGKYTTSKLLKQPHMTEIPFTGIGLRPDVKEYTLNIHSETAFSRMRFFFLGSTPSLESASSEGNTISSDVITDSVGEMTVQFDRSLCDASVLLRSDKPTVYGGVELLNDTVGTVLHSIGNNGATYGSYCNVDGMGEGIARLHPDLIIVALGTNEAFGRSTSEEITDNIDCLTGELRRFCPKAKILLVGPVECYKKKYTSYRTRRKRRRRKSVQVVNTKVLSVRNAIRDYAIREGIPYYDHYAVAGGAGAAASMKKASVLGRDGVHYTLGGYRLWGNLLADAILTEIYRTGAKEKNISPE